MRRALGICAVLCLAACATLEIEPGAGTSAGPALERFAAEGRIALRVGERSDHLRFRWERSARGDRVLLMTPLGQGMAELQRDGAGARLLRPNEPVLEAPGLPQLAQQLFSAPLPLDALGDWLRGARSTAEAEGWQVVASRTAPHKDRRLPSSVEVRRGEVDLRLVIDDWDIAE